MTDFDAIDNRPVDPGTPVLVTAGKLAELERDVLLAQAVRKVLESGKWDAMDCRFEAEWQKQDGRPVVPELVCAIAAVLEAEQKERRHD